MRFRDILTTEVHDIRIKYEAPGELRGHVRMIVAANNPNALRIKEDLTHSDREAISRRILWINCQPEARHYLTSIGGRKMTEDWVSGYGLARHIMYLHDQRAARVYDSMDRLLVPGNASSQKTRMLLTHRIPRSTLRIIVQAVQDDAFGRTTGDIVHYTDNTVEVRWLNIHMVWNQREGTYGKLPTADTGEQALEGLSVGAVIREVQGTPYKFFKIDRGILLEEARSLLDEASTKRISNFLDYACKPKANN
jgi:hypothetical protein